ncbi:HRDC domain-containing protein [Meloidogyne graminicola]|uniref:HRDC domain-containing protein n=1 Tax=Meloidogyne graminicola TaxID=189291 RepID=A0A8S9ZY64_9BILA|nr:HRDC domain-containing protein [Meloidogyne graminicola]
MDLEDNIGNKIKKLQSTTASVVKISNQMPLIGDGFELYATFPQFNQFMHTQRTRIINALRRISGEVGLKSLKINDRSLEEITQIVSVNDRLVDNIVCIFDEYQAKLNKDRINVQKLDLGAECISSSTSTSFSGISSRTFKRNCNQSEKKIPITVPKQSKNYKELLNGRQLNNRQIFALEQLWIWRDVTAKEHDKSFYYVLPDHMMLKIAEVLPREQSGILACCAPVPRLVRHDLESITRILRIARELQLEQTLIDNSDNLINQTKTDELIKFDNCVNGLKAKLEYRFDLNSFNNKKENVGKSFTNKNIELFNSSDIKEEEGNEENKNKEKNLCRILLYGNIEEIKELNVCKEKAKNIKKYFEQEWASPYETYLIALMDLKDKQIKKNKFIQKHSTINKEIKNKEKYSHLDDKEGEKNEEEELEIIGGKRIKLEEENIKKNEEIIINLDSEEEIEEKEFFADPSNLTKKAKKRMFQKLRKVADIKLN